MQLSKISKSNSRKQPSEKKWYAGQRGLGIYLIISGAVGLIASFALSLERLASLVDPDRVALCDINPILNCGSIMESAQASLFGVPHSFLGIATFSVLISVGVVLLATTKLAQWFWQLLLIGSLFGFLSVQYLVYQSLFILNTLCPWCIVIWLAVAPLFFVVSAYLVRHNVLKFKFSALQITISFIAKHAFTIAALWFITVIYMIVVQFWFYWSTLL